MSNSEKYILSIDLGGHNLRTALVNQKGEIFHSSMIRTQLDRMPDSVISQVTQVCKDLIQTHQKEFPILGVGLGIPGFIIPETGSIFSSPNFPFWKNVPIQDELSKNLSLPVAVDNDANCAAFGGYWKDNPRKYKNFIMITIGTGVGGGVIADGRIIRGARGAGSEIGHMQIDPNGEVCGCGALGCLETFISGTALEKHTGKKAKILYQEALDGSAQAKEVFNQMGHALGRALSTLCYLFDPDVISIGGRVSQAFDFFAPAAREEIKKNLPKHPAQNVTIEQSGCWDNAGILGAAKMAFDSLL